MSRYPPDRAISTLAEEQTYWRALVKDIILDAERDKHFNLDGVDVWAGIQRAATGRGGATDWELFTIQQNPQIWKSVTFWKGGVQQPNPFR